jgi:hypothetical protein
MCSAQSTEVFDEMWRFFMKRGGFYEARRFFMKREDFSYNSEVFYEAWRFSAKRERFWKRPRLFSKVQSFHNLQEFWRSADVFKFLSSIESADIFNIQVPWEALGSTDIL